MTQSTPELLPCPFCGTAWSDDADATMVQPYHNGSEGTWMIFCEGCSTESADFQTEAEAITAWNTRSTPDRNAVLLNDIAEMMGEFVDNWPEPKKVSTALALIAKTLRAALTTTPEPKP